MDRLRRWWHAAVVNLRGARVHCATCEQPIPAGRRRTCSEECAEDYDARMAW